MKKITEALPIISIAVIAISFLNLAFFYTQFGVPIQNYVEVSEIIFSLTTFFSSALYFAILLTFVSVIAVLRSKKSTSQEVIESNSSEIPASYRTSEHRAVRLFYYIFSEKVVAILFITFIAAGFWDGLSDAMTDERLRESVIWFDILGFMFVLVASTIPTLLSTPGREIKATNQPGIILLLSVIILSILFLNLRNRRRAELIISGNPKYSAKITLTDDRVYNSSDTLLYVGATKNYTFFYCTRNKSTFTISSNNIRTTELKKLREGL